MGSMNVVLELRTHAGLTQALLAKLSGIATTTVSRYETEERSPTLAILARLAAASEFDVVISLVPARSSDGRKPFVYRLAEGVVRHHDQAPVDQTPSTVTGSKPVSPSSR